jgi:hypothetical protein
LTIIKYLFCAIRTVAAQVIHKVAICGNIEYERELPPQLLKHKTDEKATNRYNRAHSDYEDDNAVYVVDEELKMRDEELKNEMRDSVQEPQLLPHLNSKLNKKASVVSFNSSLVNGI